MHFFRSQKISSFSLLALVPHLTPGQWWGTYGMHASVSMQSPLLACEPHECNKFWAPFFGSQVPF